MTILEKIKFEEDWLSEVDLTKQNIKIAFAGIRATVLEQQPKTGHWIRVDDTKLKCSECDVIHFIAMYPSGEINFCPNCGAKMEVEKNE